MGTRAFSHDSIFMPDGRAESEESIQAMSQDNLVGKVKTLQSAGMPDSLSPARLGETSHEIDEKVTPVKVSSRPKRHHSPSGTIETVNLDAIPLATACLDNSAAKHKLSVRPKNQRVSKKHRLSKEVQSVIATEFGQEILESQGSEDKISKDDSYHGPDILIQHREVQEHKTEGKRKQDHWINLETGKKEQMAEAKFKSHMEHKRLQEFEGSQGEQVGKKLKLQEEHLHQLEERKDQDHQVKGQKEQENQGRSEEGTEKLQAQMQEKSQELEERKQRNQEQTQHGLEAQRQQEEQKPCEMDMQRQREKKKKQQELEAQWQQEEVKRKCELEVQRQQQEDQKRHGLELQRQQEEAKRQHELELQRQQEQAKQQHELEVQRQQEEARRQHELELQRQREAEQKRQRELEVQRQQEEAKRQCELELQRQQEEEQKRQHELEVQRQQEEARRQRELEVQRQQEEARRQRELELKRQWEEEQKRQRELEVQRQQEAEQKRQHELEVQRQQEEARRQHELELQRQREAEQKKQRELEVRRKQEETRRQRELELQRQREEEQQRQYELEVQKQQEEARRQHELEWEEEQKRQYELEVQKQQEEEWKRHEQEAQRQQEEKKRQCEQEEQRHKECEVPKQQKVKDEKEEKRHQETEGNDNLIQQGWKDKKQEPERQKVQEEKLSHENLEKQKMKELKMGQTDESEKLSELNQQPLPEQKREIGRRQKEGENGKNLDDRDKLQEKGTAMKLKGAEEQQQNLDAKQLSTNEQKQQKMARSVGSTEHRKLEPAEVEHLWAEKEVQEEESVQRTEGLHLEGQKVLCLEELRPLENPKEEEKSHQSHMNINKYSEDENLEIIEKELPLKEEPRQQWRTQPGKEQKDEGSLRVNQGMNIEVGEQERVLGEELRWQEVDARQTMSRGFTFQVSSGEKEIIFPKVNLSPVTPTKEAPLPSATKEFKDPKSGRGSNTLPTSLCVPHTAILVTGAQLCGTAVNLNQIKDTACKSLLGLTEEKKAMDVPQPESIQKPVDGRLNSTKVKHVQDSVDNQAILAEWASIRSKILKGAENEKDNGSLNRHSDDWTTKGRSTSHGNLRKTLSANAKFSITPAWQKFSEISKTNIAAENKTATEVENAVMQLSPSTLDANNEAVQTEAPVGTKKVGTSPGKIRGPQEVAGNTEGCKFAKDLPSFLVPSLPYSPNKEIIPSETSSTMEAPQNIGSKKLDRASPSGEENVSPFGVKLRRTNYSLRFHYDQQAEQKKKKRYSAGDSFDGLPTPLVTPDNEQDAKPLFLKDSKSLSQERKDARLNSGNTTLTIISHNYTIVAPVSSPTGHMSVPGQEKSVSKSPLPPKPALAPKPISQTPPPSPLSKPRRSHFTEPFGKRVSKVEPETSWGKSEDKGKGFHLSQAPSESKNEEEESREKKSFFPSITMPWREKAEKKPESLKKERPVLQSRHSIDGSKLMEKGETAQPLWITLALQKQKGFREQQATREERRQAREAKQAEKLAKENASINNQADNKSNNMNRSNILQKSTTPEEEKKVETATSRFEHREQLKKSNTLPSSVTVEITDSVSSPPLAKEVAKRFSTPDANPVSTEPAWLALAKRKAKAWSDCPQIIK
ncbi:capping protein-inhibiting regulator of actin dynamics isoform X2 [Candoia aspera]|uniref:capping protein-inhibiting regulator of actin dynamics isoform X2 n=1 Tax=Candoia aspera TaxID=51853 RepID=UPI002FD85B89